MKERDHCNHATTAVCSPNFAFLHSVGRLFRPHLANLAFRRSKIDSNAALNLNAFSGIHIRDSSIRVRASPSRRRGVLESPKRRITRMLIERGDDLAKVIAASRIDVVLAQLGVPIQHHDVGTDFDSGGKNDVVFTGPALARRPIRQNSCLLVKVLGSAFGTHDHGIA